MSAKIYLRPLEKLHLIAIGVGDKRHFLFDLKLLSPAVRPNVHPLLFKLVTSGDEVRDAEGGVD